VLQSANRLRRSSDFATVIKSGVRARRGHLVVHLHLGLTPDAPVVGLVVGKAVGGSVVRHRVSRKLRAQLAQRVERLPAGSGTVVRALPGAADDTSLRFAGDLDFLLDRLLGAGGRVGTAGSR
jgi:ribonuclease P protein component